MITLVSLKTQKRKYAKSWLRWATCQNLAARNLGKQISSAIGVILPPLDSKERLGNPFYLETIEAINEEARHHQMTVAVASARDFDTLLKKCGTYAPSKTSGWFYLESIPMKKIQSLII